MKLFSIGHSTRSIDEFGRLLFENGIERLADIRRYPGSRRYPHFSSENLASWAAGNQPQYLHYPELGGRRKPSPDSPNNAWRNEQFRAYADHMATPEFREAMEQLLDPAVTTAFFCAEAVPWRCHRNLVADDPVRRGHEVIHILGPGQSKLHTLNPAARTESDHLIYPLDARQNARQKTL